MKSKDALKRAEDLLHIYAFLKEPKLLLNVATACFEAMVSVLDEINPQLTKQPFTQKLLYYRLHTEPKYQIDAEYATLLQELYLLEKHHKEAAVEIAKKEKVILFSDEYEQEELTQERAVAMLEKAKLFIDQGIRISLHG